MGIPQEPVGSLPRPKKLQQIYAAYDAGEASRDDLLRAQDEAAADSVKLMESTGQEYVSDGESRISSFATYAIIETLGGKGLADNYKADGQYFAIFDDGHHRQLPRLTSGPFKYQNYSSDFYEKSKGLVSKKGCSLKTAVISPSMHYLLYPLNGEVDGYPKEQFVEDLVDEAEKDIRQCFKAGSKRVSMDFTEGRLTAKKDPRNPWTSKNLLQTFVDLNNKVLDRFSAEERKNIGIHTCPGGDCDSVHSAEVDYHELLPKMFEMNAGYFLIQLASEKDKEKVFQEIGQTIRKDANGVKQLAFIGVINPQDPRVESPQEVRDALLTAAKYISPDQLGATDDCGFSPFSIDGKPKHGDPDYARDVAKQKMTNRVKGVEMASKELRV